MRACACVRVSACVRACVCVRVVLMRACVFVCGSGKGCVGTLGRFPATAQVIKHEENPMISLNEYMNSQSAGLAETKQLRVSHTIPREITLVT